MRRVYLVFVLLILLFGCEQQGQNGGSPTPPAEFTNPPIYPGAQDVEDGIQPNTTPPVRLITFYTSARPDEVFKFYNQVLPDSGHFSSYSTDEPDTLLFIAGSDGYTYGFRVTAKQESPGRTAVELHLLKTSNP